MSLYLFGLQWEAYNTERSVFYDASKPRGQQIVLVDTKIDTAYPRVTPSGPPDGGYPFAAGTLVLTPFCEGTDGVTITAQNASPHAVVTVDPTAAACAAPTVTCDLTAGYAVAGGTVTLTFATSHGPVQYAPDDVNYSPVTSPLVLTRANGVYQAYFKDAANCRQQLSYTVHIDNGGPVDPRSGVLAFSFTTTDGGSYDVYYEPASGAANRKITYYYNGGGQVNRPVVSAEELGYADGEEVRYYCETGFVQVRILASTSKPFATLAIVPNATVCGFDPGDDDGDGDEGDGDGSGTGFPLLLQQAPLDWSPVHLPVLFIFQAEPTEAGTPRPVLCCVDASEDNGATWFLCGKMRRRPGGNKLVQFNVSEFLKSRFAILAPEPGLDPNLSLRYRVRVGFATDFTGGETGELLRIDTLHVVNGAALNSGLGSYLSDLIPLPEGFPYLLSKITSAGVSNQTHVAGLTPAACPPYPLRLTWLNQRGGWNSFVFTGKHEHGTDTQDGIPWVDETGADRYASRGVVRDTVKVYSDRLLPELASLVRTIRKSVQVYEVPAAGSLIPVLVQEGSFVDFRRGEKAPTVDFVISYPRQAVQTQ